MRSFAGSEEALLKVVEQFGRIEKYQGITPEEMLFPFDRAVIGQLLDEEILEKARLKSYSQKIKGVRLTVRGAQLWSIHNELDEHVPLITETALLVRDIYHHTRLSYTEEAVPKAQLLRYHSKGSLREAFEMGFVAKVKIRQKNREVAKGYIVTCAGYAFLKGNKLL